MEESLEKIPLSALNHFAYCPRRCYLIHAEADFIENVHTIRGTHEHTRVDLQHHTSVAGVRVEYALPVWSERLGLTGRCDVVEFHPDGVVFPVEYKHGKRRKWINDDLQLAAQALCLEEMLDTRIEQGAIFHHQSRRRREVVFNSDLRKMVTDTVDQVRQLLAQSSRPAPVSQKQRCKQCSLETHCQPELSYAASRVEFLKQQLFAVEDEAD